MTDEAPLSPEPAPPEQTSAAPWPLDRWLQAIDAAERAGHLLQACDLAARGAAGHPQSDELRYRHLLALARCGALTTAERLWRRAPLPGTDLRFASLGARLLRDRALRMRGTGRDTQLRQAATVYAALFDRSGSPFPGINAAVLMVLAGERDAGEDLARRVLASTEREHAETTLDAYNLAADRTAALLILDREAEADAAGDTLVGLAENAASLASTRKQLTLLARTLGRGAALLEKLRPRPSLHFTGHMMAPPGAAGRFPATAEAAVATEIAAAVEAIAPGAAYGSAAAGGDLLVAEALLRRGTPLHLVLPFDPDPFIRESVAPSGERWIARFQQVLRQATSLRQVTEGPFLGDAAVFGHTTRLAMGLARLRHRIEGADCHQLAIWDGLPGAGPAGTGPDVGTWKALGLPTTVVSSRADAVPNRGGGATPVREHRLRAFLFGDFKGFSRLGEGELLTFNDRLLPLLAEVIDAFGVRVESRNTWGDGLFLVFDGAAAAADCALGLQRALRQLDRASLGLPDSLSLRLALHAGPVFVVQDAITGRPSFTGRHISRTARMEPVTPEGEVYVSESFAALMALESDGGSGFEYVGSLPLAKGAGDWRMYLLTSESDGG